LRTVVPSARNQEMRPLHGTWGPNRQTTVSKVDAV